jgi:hypothetical protein
MNDDPLDNMRARVEQFRKLADLTHDHEMRLSLRGWADDIEKDLRRLEDERLERRAG